MRLSTAIFAVCTGLGLIACHYRAAEWRHKEIELAAHELLQYLDRKSASRRGAARRGPS